MAQSTTATFTPAASLAALGCYVRQLDLWAPIRAGVRIAQKTVIHTPLDKLYDAWIAILARAARAETASLWAQAHDAGYVPYQWLSGLYLPWALDRDRTESTGAAGSESRAQFRYPALPVTHCR